jgi:CRP-like cAMP-binding protein
MWAHLRDKWHARRLRSADDDAIVDGELALTWLTHQLDPAARASLARFGQVVEVPEGTVLFREGEPTNALSIVLEGRVALRLRVPERGQVTIQTVEPGDVIGWSAVVPPFRATSTGTALAACRLARFDGPALREALASDRDLAAALYPTLLGAVARRLEGTRLQLLDLFSQRWVEPW